MKYYAYKLSFTAGIHFGDGVLCESKNTFCADTLFSALCIEALRFGRTYIDKLYTKAKNGDILLSDGFPYIQDTLYVPRPFMALDHSQTEMSERKKWKKLKYVPIYKLGMFLEGKFDILEESKRLSGIGYHEVRQSVSLENPVKAEPYSVGVYHFSENCGLYFLVGYKNEEDCRFILDLVDSLGYQGFGGKVSSGLGKFSAVPVELPDEIQQKLPERDGDLMLLSTSLPRREECREVLQDSSYLMQKRSGFIQSDSFERELVKKSDMFFLQAGSCVKKYFTGDVYDVGKSGAHPVWRYGKPIFMEVRVR